MFTHRLSPVLELRVLEEAHAEELFKLVDRNRDHLKPWMPWVGATKKVDDTLAFIRTTRKQLADDNGFQCGIFFSGNLVGVVGFHGIDKPNRSTSLGYWLSEDAQGKGIMTLAVKTLVHHAIVERKLHRVTIACGVNNKKSNAIPKRVGFKEEGVARGAEWVDDKPMDHQVWSVLATEWPPKE